VASPERVVSRVALALPRIGGLGLQAYPANQDGGAMLRAGSTRARGSRRRTAAPTQRLKVPLRPGGTNAPT
jgi:hypothetical protein